jgi:hypothetical protein
VREFADLDRVRDLVAEQPGVARGLAGSERAEVGLDHPRAGELVALAEPDAWFAYYYWLDDDRAPDFARLVDIHRKPGYDPAELFLDPADPRVKLRAGLALARKKLGMRYLMSVVALNGSAVRGSHGLLPADPADGPMLLCSDPTAAKERYHATEVKDLLLRLARE